MRGRIGRAVAVALTVALGVGCASSKMTPEEKTRARQEQQAAADAKAAQKQAEQDARAAREQARREYKQAQARAREEQKQAALADARWREQIAKATPQPQNPIPFEPQQFPDIYPDDRLNVIGYPIVDPENNPRLFDAHAKAAAAAGARQDGMLSAAHFDGNELSDLGRSKVALMLHNVPSGQPVVSIWVVRTGTEEQAKARMAAVERFWKESRYAAVPARVRDGINPDATTPASAGISALNKMNRASSGTPDATQSGGETTGGRGRAGAGSSSSPGSSSGQ